MPELPEVETVMRGLEPVMMGQKIRYADIRRPDLRWPFPENMSQRLTGAKDFKASPAFKIYFM